MKTTRIAMSALAVALVVTTANAQQEVQSVESSSRTETIEEENAQPQQPVHGERAGPNSARTSKQATATLDNVTWEFLSRMAAQLFSGNRATLLSGNEPEVLSSNRTNLASGNELQLLSGNKISLFSNIRIEIQVSGVSDPKDAKELMSGHGVRIGRPGQTAPLEQPSVELEAEEVPDVDVEEVEVEEEREDELEFEID